ncbi:MAG TPA: hypothetical protein VMU04_11360 [Candidatus Acidoferrum sp.]|nr:hypothetical protein [Candidatus Acidoferrum sp.]
MPDFKLCQLDPPTRLRAGFTGDEQHPFYFDCALCGAKEPPIAGALASGLDGDGSQVLSFDKIAILTPTDGRGGSSRHALYCAACFAKEVAAAQAAASAPQTRHDPLSEPAVSAAGAPTPQQQQHTDTTIMDRNTTAAAPAAAARTVAPNTRTAVFTKAKETPHAEQFKEVVEEGQPPICGTLYLKDWVAGRAQNVRMTVELS